jgi:hypothetical protein
VEQQSAVRDGSTVRQQGINASHSDMVKFSQRNDPGYKPVLQHIESILAEHARKTHAAASSSAAVAPQPGNNLRLLLTLPPSGRVEEQFDFTDTDNDVYVHRR